MFNDQRDDWDQLSLIEGVEQTLMTRFERKFREIRNYFERQRLLMKSIDHRLKSVEETGNEKRKKKKNEPTIQQTDSSQTFIRIGTLAEFQIQDIASTLSQLIPLCNSIDQRLRSVEETVHQEKCNKRNGRGLTHQQTTLLKVREANIASGCALHNANSTPSLDSAVNDLFSQTDDPVYDKVSKNARSLFSLLNLIRREELVPSLQPCSSMPTTQSEHREAAPGTRPRTRIGQVKNDQRQQLACKQSDRIDENKIHLSRHVHSHSEECTHDCGLCGKTFSSKSRLSNHYRYHQPKRLPCPKCERKFRFPYMLKRHVELYHKWSESSAEAIGNSLNDLLTESAAAHRPF